MDDDDRAEFELVEAHRLADAAAGFVHEGLRHQQRDALAADRAVGDQALKARAERADSDARAAIASIAMKPMLWRFFAWRAPGLPRPAISIMSSLSAAMARPRRKRAGRRRSTDLLLGGGLGRRGGALGGSGSRRPAAALAGAAAARRGGRAAAAAGAAAAGASSVIDGRRHDRHDRESALTSVGPATLGQLQIRDVHRIVEVEAGQIDRDRLGNRFGGRR